MAAQNRNMIPLDTVVTDYIEESEQGVHKYSKIWNIAFRGMEQLGLDFFYKIQSRKLPVNANKTVSLPSDYLNYTKIGVLNDNGEIIPLKQKNKITSYADLKDSRTSDVVDDTLDSFNLYNESSPFFYNYNQGGFFNTYGAPSGAPFVGSFKIDNANGVIVLDIHFSYKYVIIEYVCAPKEGNEYFIPVQFREALIAYMAWVDIRSMPTTRRGNISDKEHRKTVFYNERRLANARYKPVYLEQQYELQLEMQRLTVKA